MCRFLDQFASGADAAHLMYSHRALRSYSLRNLASVFSMDKTHHVVQSRAMGIGKYTGHVRFESNHSVEKLCYPINLHSRFQLELCRDNQSKFLFLFTLIKRVVEVNRKVTSKIKP